MPCILDGWEDFDSDGYLNLEEIAAGTDLRDGSKKPDGITTNILIVRDSLPAGTLLPVGISTGSASHTSRNNPQFTSDSFYQDFEQPLAMVTSPSTATGYEVSASYQRADGAKDFAFKELKMATSNLEADTTYRPKFYLSHTLRSTYESTDDGQWDVDTGMLFQFPWSNIRHEEALVSDRWEKLSVTDTNTYLEWPYLAGYRSSNYDEIDISETSSGIDDFDYEFHRKTSINPDFTDESHSGTEQGRPITPSIPANREPAYTLSGSAKVTKDTPTEQITESVIHFFLPWSDLAIGDPLYENGPVNEVNDTQTIDSTETMSRILTEEYTDGKLSADLNELMGRNNEPFGFAQGGSLGTVLAYNHWSDDHVNHSRQYAQYKLTHRVSQPGLTKIVFMWAEAFYRDKEHSDAATPEPEFKMMKKVVTSGLTLNSNVETSVRSVKVLDVPGMIAIPNASVLSTSPVIQITGDPAATTPATGSLAPLSFHTPVNYHENTVTLEADSPAKIKVWVKPENGTTYSAVTLPYTLKPEEKSGTISKPRFHYALQGLEAGTVHLSLKMGGDEIIGLDVELIDLDLDIDSDNTGTIQHTPAEDRVEALASEPGKIVVPNLNGDANNDGIANCADMVNAGKFTEITLKTDNLRASDMITFNYDACDPRPDSTTGITTHTPLYGQLRIWKKDGDVPRDVNSDFIATFTQNTQIQPRTPKRYSLAELGIISGHDATFYVEALGASGKYVIEVGTGLAKDAVTLLPMEVKEVSFGGAKYHELKNDDLSVTYAPPHWLDKNKDGKATDTANGERDYSVSYTQGTIPSIGARFGVMGLPNNIALKLRATGSDGVNISEIAVQMISNEIALPLSPCSKTWPHEIKFYDRSDISKVFKLDWEIKVGDSGWARLGSTNHQVYLTLNDPLTTLKQESLFYFGAKNANGFATEDSARDAMFGEFSDTKVLRLDQVRMTYWAPNVLGVPQAGATETPDLLTRSDGNGNCQAWSALFRDILRVQGIDADRVKVFPKAGDSSVIVKDWRFNSPPTGPAGHPYLDGIDAFDLMGIEGQGNLNPPGAFNGHWVTKSGGYFYDPSYGTPPVKGGDVEKKYEDGAFDGFGAFYSMPGGGTIRGIRKNDTGSGIKEVVYSLDN